MQFYQNGQAAVIEKDIKILIADYIQGVPAAINIIRDIEKEANKGCPHCQRLINLINNFIRRDFRTGACCKSCAEGKPCEGCN